MSLTSYVPYPELEVSWWANQEGLDLRTPWVEISVDVEPADRERISQQTSRAIDSEFLSVFSDFPVSYSAPRDHLREQAESPSTSQLGSAFAAASGFDEIFSFLLGNSPATECLKGDFSWSAQEVFSSARIGNSAFYDPMTVYGLIRRLRLCSEQSESSQLGIYSELESLRIQNEPAFFDLCRTVLRQTHFVTSSCHQAVSPALKLPELKQDTLKTFLHQEKGHENLILKSLASLQGGSKEIRSLPIFEETDLSMRLLQVSAEKLPLAFCCVVGVFEGTNYAEKDPLGAILERSSIPNAARGVQKHFEINRDLDHSRVGEELLSTLGGVSRNQVIAAIRITELVVLAGNSLTQRIARMIASARNGELPWT